MKPAEKGRQGESTPRLPHTPITASVSSRAAFVFTASISGGAGNGINGMLRKEFYVVRKKYHVVRKLFYVASIFGGAAGRRNRPPWELSSTAWEVSSTAGHFSSTASCQCVCRTPVFGSSLKQVCLTFAKQQKMVVISTNLVSPVCLLVCIFAIVN